jgi:ComF family protein
MRYKLTSITQMLRLPIICTLCHQSHVNNVAICDDCRKLLHPLGPACLYCAHPLPPGKPLIACGQCIQKKPALDCVMTAYRFEEPLRTLLHEFKYREELYLTTFLSQLMLQALHLNIEDIGCLVPVPMHAKRLRQRGFNHAAVLAQHLAKKLSLPYQLNQCQKIINTPPQASLSALQRQKNLRGAFFVKSLPYHCITLVDDLFTTGSTANELARILKAQGALRVNLWCCARAIASQGNIPNDPRICFQNSSRGKSFINN